MNHSIIFIVGSLLGVSLAFFSIKNLIYQIQLKKKAIPIAKESIEKIVDTLNLDKHEVKDSALKIHMKDLETVQSIFSNKIYQSSSLSPVDKSELHKSLRQDNLTGQIDYLKDIFTLTGATHSFIVVPDNESIIEKLNINDKDDEPIDKL